VDVLDGSAPAPTAAGACAPAPDGVAPPQSAEAALPALAELVGRGGAVVLSGAGISTDSGIPDYRGPTGAQRRGTPMTYQTFTGDAGARQRYWGRSHLGWRQVAAAEPSTGHLAVAELERRGLVRATITQNVDGLHRAAGAREVVELHGNLDRVVCLDCGARSPRADLDRRLGEANPDWRARVTGVNPDGDVDVDDAALARFRVVGCPGCDGVLKPDVVFFGENVPADRVQRCFALVESASALLVLGSSLTVMSGRRFVLRAEKRGLPVAIVNQGVTRGDPQACVRVDAPLGDVLPALVGALDGCGPVRSG
jgi:NAD-dependent SIR2 family protein deacetylase